MRATIRDGALTLVPRQFATVTGGPIGCLARAALPRDAAVADLRFGVEDEDEGDQDPGDDDGDSDGDGDPQEPEDLAVEVRFLANDGPDARRALKRWAARTGHERIWFRDEVCDLEPPPEVDGEHGTTCPCCGLEITDSGPELIGFVHEVGHFPLNCFVCGSFVPQWTPLGNRYRPDGSAGYGEPTSPPALQVVGGQENGER